MGWRFHIRNEYDRASISAWLIQERPDGKQVFAKPFELEIREPGVAVAKPTIDIPDNEAKAMLQAIVDACWEFGIKPTGYDDFRRENDALGNHLQDMRAIVAKTTKVTLP